MQIHWVLIGVSLGSISHRISPPPPQEPPLNTVERPNYEYGVRWVTFAQNFICVHREFIGDEFQNSDQRIQNFNGWTRVNPMKFVRSKRGINSTMNTTSPNYHDNVIFFSCIFTNCRE